MKANNRPWRVANVLEELNTAKDTLENYMSDLEKKIEEKREAAGVVSHLLDYPSLHSGTTETQIDLWYNKCNEIKEKNATIINNNLELNKQLRTIIRDFGIPSTETVYNKRKRKNETIDAKWLTSFGELIPTYDNKWNGVKYQYENLKKKIEDDNKKAFAAKVKEEQERAVKEKQDKVNSIVGYIKVKYGFDISLSSKETLDQLLLQNQHLFLSHYMMKNRNDWSDGTCYAEIGLNHFDPVTDEDREIFNSVSDTINAYDGDGRIFRDCDWDYGRILQLVPDELYRDYNSLIEALGDY